MELSKKDKARRERLRIKMCEHQDEARKYRRQIDAIDNKLEEERRAAVLGKCFHLKDNMGYARIERFRKDGIPYGTNVGVYGGKLSRIEFDQYIFWDYIEGGKRIPASRFNRYLKRANDLINTKK